MFSYSETCSGRSTKINMNPRTFVTEVTKSQTKPIPLQKNEAVDCYFAAKR